MDIRPSEWQRSWSACPERAYTSQERDHYEHQTVTARCTPSGPTSGLTPPGDDNAATVLVL